MKPFYLSKTFWMNLIMGVAVPLVPALGQHVNEEILISVFAGVNIVLRFFTKDQVTIS